MDDLNGPIFHEDILINIGDIDNIEGIIEGKWKLVKSTYKNGSYDNYFGEDGRGLPNPSYNISIILDSPVFKALQTVKNSTKNNANNMLHRIKTLRKDATISCPEIDRRHSDGPYCTTYCLFDIENDPCEGKNIISSNQQVAEYLKSKLKSYRTEMVPQTNKPVSPISNPKFYNNTWVSWLDEKYINQSRLYEVESLRSSGMVCCVSYFSFLVILICSMCCFM